MVNTDWWKPKNLKTSEKAFLEKEHLDELDTENDFGSYKVMRIYNDVERSQILSHNDLQPNYHVKTIKKLLKNYSPKSIVDVGCGLGFTTNELKNIYPNASITGIDISEDAIAYAHDNFTLCSFLCEPIDPDNMSQNFEFDLIIAFEFYPFTRTGLFDNHVKYLNHLTKDLTEEGKLVIMQAWNNPESLSKNFEILRHHFSDLDFKIYDMPIKKIGVLLRSRLLAVWFSALIRPFIRFLTSRHMNKNKLIVVTKK
tara:strand:- start:265 stop:1029 length:765 start_codon:yes stop_codon:yes gene_type:complete